MSREFIGVTGPSRFTPNVLETIENYIGCNYIELNQTKRDNVMRHLDTCKAVILSGGNDIHPQIYGSIMPAAASMQVMSRVRYSSFDAHRDILELQVIEYCQKRGIPLLGICRGHQMMGVFKRLGFMPEIGGSIICHSPSSIGMKVYPSTKNENKHPFHAVFLMGDHVPVSVERAEIERITQSCLSTRVLVNSFHHQAIPFRKTWDCIPKDSKEKETVYQKKGVKVMGRSLVKVDKVEHNIEYMCGTDWPWLSVQWHPEFDHEVNSASKMIWDIFKKMVDKNCLHDDALNILVDENPERFYSNDKMIAAGQPDAESDDESGESDGNALPEANLG